MPGCEEIYESNSKDLAYIKEGLKQCKKIENQIKIALAEADKNVMEGKEIFYMTKADIVNPLKKREFIDNQDIEDLIDEYFRQKPDLQAVKEIKQLIVDIEADLLEEQAEQKKTA